MMDQPAEMRCLTLTQPWAGLVAAGVKPDENRDQRVITRASFGTPFAVHASREIDQGAYGRVMTIAPHLWRGWDEGDPTSWPAWYRLSRITSAVIGVATVDRLAVVANTGGPDRQWLRDPHRMYERICPLAERPFAAGPFVYMLRDQRALAEPVKCRGWMGFWRLSPDLCAAVRSQLP